MNTSLQRLGHTILRVVECTESIRLDQVCNDTDFQEHNSREVIEA